MNAASNCECAKMSLSRIQSILKLIECQLAGGYTKRSPQVAATTSTVTSLVTSGCGFTATA